MEPPLLVVAAGIGLLALCTIFLATSYEATFALLSRSTLEKLEENKVIRAHLMSRIYEPRHRLHLFARMGQALGTILLTLAFFTLTSPLGMLFSYHLGLTALVSLSFSLLASTPRRIRFEEEEEENRIPPYTLFFVPLHHLLSPLVKLIEHTASSDYTSESFKAEKEEELRTIVEAESETGVLEEGEKEMIQGVFGLHDSIVREIMIPRIDMTAAELTTSLAALLQMIRESGHSRVPIYEDTLDHIRGVVYAKDLLQLLTARPDLDLNTTLGDLMDSTIPQTDKRPVVRSAHFVPETKKTDELLGEFRNLHTRLALVVDEYGGTAGLATMEDVVEEIIGDIQDEYDREEDLYRWLVQNEVLLVNARINIDDLNELLDLDLPNEDYDTLGGLIYDHLGNVPQKNQVMETYNLQITILKIEEQRITQVQIKRLDPEENKAASPAE